jgi:hypothetical protein
MFGCCSSYLKCSKIKKCLHLTDREYEGCAYRLNLEAGRVFYLPAEKAPTISDSTSIFLNCFNRLFSVYARNKNLFSMALTSEQLERIEATFIREHIPYKLQIEDMSECIIDYPTEQDPTPANSRVVFSIDDEEFHVLNFNSWLIKRAIAEKIFKAFDNHFVSARVELRGRYANVTRVEPHKPEQFQVKRELPEVKKQDIIPEPPVKAVAEEKPKQKPVVYHQVNIFEIMQRAVG